MEFAIKEAEKALEKGEVPIGAVIVFEDQIIGRGHNLTETLLDATAHAEMIAITAGAASQASWRLDGATVYVTVEPCPMCCGAILLSRMVKVVYGTEDPRFGGCGSVPKVNVMSTNPFGPPVQVISGVKKSECQSLLKAFFQKMRENAAPEEF
jgi:tRNA(adenine34) deaminase